MLFMCTEQWCVNTRAKNEVVAVFLPLIFLLLLAILLLLLLTRTYVRHDIKQPFVLVLFVFVNKSREGEMKRFLYKNIFFFLPAGDPSEPFPAYPPAPALLHPQHSQRRSRPQQLFRAADPFPAAAWRGEAKQRKSCTFKWVKLHFPCFAPNSSMFLSCTN